MSKADHTLDIPPWAQTTPQTLLFGHALFVGSMSGEERWSSGIGSCEVDYKDISLATRL